jgi:xylose isomerase
MDVFARALLIADRLLHASPYLEKRKERYASFDDGEGAAFEQGRLSLEDLHRLASQWGEPPLVSGRQEWFEQLINQYI